MDLSLIQPIQNESALFIEEKKIFVIADLHIGIETELQEKGLHTSSQTERMVKRFNNICQRYNPEEIILLGDIKHMIPTISIQERIDVKQFLETINENRKIHIIPGNHDGNIHRLTPDGIKIHSSKGYTIDNIGFAHGHRWPSEEVMNSEIIITAHSHPTVMFRDRLDYRTFEPCWIRGKFFKKKIYEKYPNSQTDKIIIMPAFNPLCSGVAINKEGLTGPFKKIVDIKKAEVFLLDGTSIGLIRDIY